MEHPTLMGMAASSRDLNRYCQILLLRMGLQDNPPQMAAMQGQPKSNVLGTCGPDEINVVGLAGLSHFEIYETSQPIRS